MSLLLLNMIKEEWRVHSTLFGNLNFALLPILIMVFGFAGGFFSSVFTVVFTTSSMLVFAHISFFFFGSTVGAFGVSGQEFMNRRFGQASLLAYSSRSLPISERIIFISMVLKDIIYYFFIWVLPLVLGFFSYELIFSTFIFTTFLLSLGSLSISFLLGLSTIFFISSIYAHSSRVFILFISLLSFSLFHLYSLLGENLLQFLVPYHLIASKNYFMITLIFLSIAIFILISLLFVRFDFKQKVSTYANQYKSISKSLGFSKFRIFLSKDILDLKRSHGGFGKIIFSYAVPLIFIFLFVDFFRSAVIGSSFTVILSILLGIFSASIYTWITEHDLFSQYLFLPVKKSHLIKSKIFAYWIINIVSYLVVVLTSIYMRELGHLFISLLIFSVVSFYSLSLTIFLTGLLPSIRFMNAKILFTYFVLIVPLMLLFIFIHEFFYAYMFPLIAFVMLVSFFLIRHSFAKWGDEIEQGF